jgi:RNA polymerase sigma-70 factor (ECF subfamily)
LNSLLNSQPIDDGDLLVRVAQRDRYAFEQFYDRHAGKALGLALRVLPERTVAEEIVQEAFWRVWQSANGFDRTRGSAETWLLSIVRHLAIDMLRQRGARPTVVNLDDEEGGERDMVDSAQNVAEQAWASVQSVEMREALNQLPAPQRVVIEMAYYEGLSRQEIATRLDVPLGTIHTRARLGLLKLKELLSAMEVGSS